ncbi:MAG: 3-phosphoshikimate 1-carboxyvinyltransferase, partial [Burkholderiaceae bacterium]
MPGSKSISNRALLLSALAHGQTALLGLLEADDTRVMLEALGSLGIHCKRSETELYVDGCRGKFPVRNASLSLGNAGTAFRSLTAALAFSGGRYELDGVARMRERPIGDLVDALNMLGARIRYAGASGFPPLVIEPTDSFASDRVSIKADVSSQFLSGLLIAAPMMPTVQGLSIAVDGRLISEPYVELTISLMKQFGVDVEREGDTYLVPHLAYQSPGRFFIEGDASNASYFLALGAIAGGPARVDGVGENSVQGDVRFADRLAEMGVRIEFGEHHITASRGAEEYLSAIDADCNHIPDAAMTLAIVALFADAPSTLRNIASWRVKETDRIAAMAAELTKLGATVAAGADFIEVTAPSRWRPATIHTYDDHRIAMCFSLAAFGGVPVRIVDPKCVAKTYPGYFEALFALVEAEPAAIPVITVDGPTASGKGTLAAKLAR